MALPGPAHADLPAQATGSGRPGPAGGAVIRPWRLRDTMTTDDAWAWFLRGQDLLWTRYRSFLAEAGSSSPTVDLPTLPVDAAAQDAPAETRTAPYMILTTHA